jgi:hypothetical protein
LFDGGGEIFVHGGDASAGLFAQDPAAHICGVATVRRVTRHFPPHARVLLIVVLLMLAACAGETPSVESGASAPGTVAVVTTALPAEPATSVEAASAPAQAIPGVASLTSGRGDDGSLEVGVWFASDPFTSGDYRVRVGTDSDDSYPGVGDPTPHVDGWAEVMPGGVVLREGATVVADQVAGLGDWFSWTGPGRTAWFYFIGNVPVRAGTLWVMVEVDGKTPVGGVAGAPVGEACSYHGSGLDLGSVPGDIPQPGRICRYP